MQRNVDFETLVAQEATTNQCTPTNTSGFMRPDTNWNIEAAVNGLDRLSGELHLKTLF